MILTETQKTEIREFIGTVPKYQETYDELYDHILSSLGTLENENYNIDLVARIVNEDFGGFKNIVCVEADYNKQAMKNVMRDLRQEMKQQFYFPELWKTLIILALCAIIYNYSSGDFKIIRIIFGSVILASFTPIFYYWGNRLLFKKKGSRPSIKDGGFAQQSMMLMQVAHAPFFIFIDKDAFLPVTYPTALIVTLFMFFFSSIYIRSYFRLYNRNVKILLSR